jgi:hypothetical protein
VVFFVGFIVGVDFVPSHIVICPIVRCFGVYLVFTFTVVFIDIGFGSVWLSTINPLFTFSIISIITVCVTGI